MVLPPLLLLNNSFIIDFSNIFHASVVRHPTGGGGASITAAMFEAGLLLWALSALCGFFGMWSLCTGRVHLSVAAG